ncbi:hypothetical protein FBEOM_14344 [Fusarium beomiforme]|uniref:Uncharacterized protein n=1 Tax=Fusarium beomiforme TaxID=44412 RepID=A0A9P5A3Y3_9HYPO|nr:hypothetical protein FBEOM_14344 [Fusarium beomiforme]
MGLTALVGVGLGLHFQHSNAISNRIHKDIRDRIEGAALLNMSLMGGISMALIIAGAVYENRGMSLLKSALGSFTYDEGDLREALAGVSRDTGGGDEAHTMIAYGANATCKAIALLFYIVASSGALCSACGIPSTIPIFVALHNVVSTADSYTNSIMAQQLENDALNFHEENFSCKRMTADLLLFHRDAMRRSDTYHSMIHAVLAFGHADVYVREHLEHHSARVISILDQRFDTHLTRIEISRSAIEAQARMVPETQRSKVIGILAVSYLIHGVRKALRFDTHEDPRKTAEHHQPEDDRLLIERGDLVLQEERNSTALSQPDGEDIWGSSSADTIGRICGEIREHRIFL